MSWIPSIKGNALAIFSSWTKKKQKSFRESLALSSLMWYTSVYQRHGAAEIKRATWRKGVYNECSSNCGGHDDRGN